MATKKQIYIIATVLVSALVYVFRVVISKQPSLGLLDILFLFGLFTSWTDSAKKRKVYKIAFVSIALLSLFNEGIMKNAGGNNWANFGWDLLIKLLSGIIIFSYMKNVKNEKN